MFGNPRMHQCEHIRTVPPDSMPRTVTRRWRKISGQRFGDGFVATGVGYATPRCMRMYVNDHGSLLGLLLAQLHRNFESAEQCRELHLLGSSETQTVSCIVVSDTETHQPTSPRPSQNIGA